MAIALMTARLASTATSKAPNAISLPIVLRPLGDVHVQKDGVERLARNHFAVPWPVGRIGL